MSEPIKERGEVSLAFLSFGVAFGKAMGTAMGNLGKCMNIDFNVF